jgi:multidrug resistance efflux pump
MGAAKKEHGDPGSPQNDPRHQRVTAEQQRVQMLRMQSSLGVLAKSLQLLSAVNKPRRFVRAAMVFCNEMCSQWDCERVSLGVLKGRMIRVKATSHTEQFTRKMQLIQSIESAMEECLDQDSEIVYPGGLDATTINKAASTLSQQHGPSAIVSLPMHLDGDLLAVTTLERPANKPFDAGAIEAISLTTDLAGSRLLNLQEQDRWFGAKWLDVIHRMLGFVVGSQHTLAKCTVLLLVGLVLWATLTQGNYRTKSSCILEATVQQSICAPFDGYIKTVHVEIGDRVESTSHGLAELDTTELALQLASAKAERVSHLKQGDAYMRDGQTAQAQIAQADADKTAAQIALLNHQIEQASLRSPIAGTLVTGDLKRQIGVPVKKGDILFEVTPLETLRGQVYVSEDQVLDISEGLDGAMATVSYPDQRIPFIVERISPMAEVVNNRNVFKVQVRLLNTHQWMRPGMEGIAKIEVGKRRHLWIWTRKAVNWVRMKLWI